MRRHFLKLALVLVVCMSCAGVNLVQAQTAKEVKITLTDFAIAMSTNSLPANTPITFVITNNGKVTHEVVLEKAGDVDKALEVNGTTYEADDIAPGATKTVVWTVPTAGNYQLGCHVTGHFEAGMKTLFTVAGASNIAAAPSSAPAAGGGGTMSMPATGLGAAQPDNTSWLLALAALLTVGTVATVGLRLTRKA